MSETTPEQPARDGEDLAEIRAEIDELKAVPEEELVSPTPAGLLAAEPEPEPTDPIGSADDDDTEPTTAL
ncbi:hypothetical protein FBY40_2491 [Microbacterium sp. SLBN-154]|uniref:hypothetical protein n=1 Tax=unclassified Microbacterium TaxID=2609290 RepID=UPI00115180F8|nr:hypothetical protein [Microbacterium sp. SLBN-154]TQK19972.1 hypothetical protein FBY40_2491 [Microbacterium sp. SLBN-154]